MYERVSPADARILARERDAVPQHVGTLMMVEAGSLVDADGRFRIEAAREHIVSRLHLVPRFRKRLMTVPLGQGRPVWVDDGDFDPTYHVRLTALPRPGGYDQLRALVGRIQSHRLDRRRPLWELWFVDGLEGDHIGLITKTHLTMVDDRSRLDLLSVIVDEGPGAGKGDEPQPWAPGRPPHPLALLGASMAHRMTSPDEVVRSARALARGPHRLARRATDVAQIVSDTRRHTVTPLSVPVSAHRRWDTARVDLDELSRVAGGAGVSVHDVILAGVSGALRSWLRIRGLDVDRLRLPALVPYATDGGPDGDRLAGGEPGPAPAVRLRTVELPVALDDPAERLRAVAAAREPAGERAGGWLPADEIAAASGYLPPTLLLRAGRAVMGSRRGALAVVDVPGPTAPRHLMGAEVTGLVPVTPIRHRMALSIGAMSSRGTVAFGLTADRDVVPDLGSVSEALGESFAELGAG